MYIDCERVERITGAINEMASAIVVYNATLCEGLEPPEFMEFEDDDRYILLKSATKLVRLLDLTLACYPLTESSVLLLDADGEPIP